MIVSSGQEGEDKNDLTVYKVTKKIFKTEGFLRFYAGVYPKMSQAWIQKFVYFYIYAALTKIYKMRATMNVPASLAIGYLAGVGNIGLTLPIETVATRLQANADSGFLKTAKVGFS